MNEQSGPTPFAPADEHQAAALLAEAGARERSFTIVGGGTRAGLGRPPEDGASVLSTRNLNGITLFEPAELVISARAGTPLAEVEGALAGAGLMLPFEPMDHRALYRTTGEPTVGAVAAANISGPRRLSAGAARDHLIGVRLVNGRGEVVKSGGRVMKNVTGLDLVKLSCGAHGTLGLLTEVTFKLLPRPERVASLAVAGLSLAGATGVMTAALRLPFEVAAAAHLPAGLAGEQSLTLLRLEGFADAVADRLGRLASALGQPVTTLEGEAGEALWGEIRDARFLAGPEFETVLRVHVAPSRAARLLAGAGNTRVLLDWAGGLVWVGLKAGESPEAWRAAARALGGHTTIVRASAAQRRDGAVFEPPSEPVMRLTTGLKSAFDPEHRLNAGRMYAGA